MAHEQLPRDNPTHPPEERFDVVSAPDVAPWEEAPQNSPAGEIVDAEVVRSPQSRRRRIVIPVVLFLLTCLSTFWVGATDWAPIAVFNAGWQDHFLSTRMVILKHWPQGLAYMACALAILLTHELGHFFATVFYRIRASLPIFIPFPANPLGTLGAVIVMNPYMANRRQIFDIGIAGPLAGLIFAVPIMWYGTMTLDLTTPSYGIELDIPIAVRWLMNFYQPPGYEPGCYVAISQVNPFFMAGWFGLVVTGLNMFPISQLDGGHVTYTICGKAAHWIARGFMVASIAYVTYTWFHPLALMVILVLMLGTDHPPTSDDKVPLGWFRTVLGCASFAIPILCFPPRVFILNF